MWFPREMLINENTYKFCLCDLLDVSIFQSKRDINIDFLLSWMKNHKICFSQIQRQLIHFKPNDYFCKFIVNNSQMIKINMSFPCKVGADQYKLRGTQYYLLVQVQLFSMIFNICLVRSTCNVFCLGLKITSFVFLTLWSWGQLRWQVSTSRSLCSKIYWCHHQINNNYYKFEFIKTGWGIINCQRASRAKTVSL